MRKLDSFPIVKAHIDRLPAKFQRNSELMVEKELKKVDIASLSDADKYLLESDLRDMLDHSIEEYYESRKGDI
jgi:S-adenosylmethionine:diacylglycerol 3-amino-3-carboxypropyl transferase